MIWIQENRIIVGLGNTFGIMTEDRYASCSTVLRDQNNGGCHLFKVYAFASCKRL